MSNTPLTDVDASPTEHNSELRYAYDPASPDGDYSGLTIRNGDKVYTYTGDEADTIKALIGTIAEQIKREAYCDVGNYAADSGDTKLMDFIDARLSHPAPQDGSATTEAPERLKDYMENKSNE